MSAEISIIICTYNRIDSLLPALEAAADSMRHAKNIQCELAVIDNNSNDSTADSVKEWCNKNTDIAAFYVMEPKKGLSHARNCGIAHTQGKLLVFTDDDCHLPKDYLENAYKYFSQDSTPTLRSGQVLLGDCEDLPVSIKTGKEFVEYSRAENSAHAHNVGTLLMGCNMNIPRQMIDALGAFDANFGAGSPMYGGEDTDYVMRAYAAGYIIQFVPDLRLYHYHGRRNIADVKALKKSYIISNGGLYLKHLFIHPPLCKPAYWDMKKSIKEIILRKNLLDETYNISYRKLSYYYIIGALKYTKLRVSCLLTPSTQE
ncbi:MAG: glycosyltransferase [Alphaproteobacteria bacterium]|nr:glycosyltransferase [Alphaproteobacteria bacterium]